VYGLSVPDVRFFIGCNRQSLLVCSVFTAQGSLLVLAQDLGDRLLPAFLESPTGLPFAWVNLRHGVSSTIHFRSAMCVAR
jgi:hypothetical protein